MLVLRKRCLEGENYLRFLVENKEKKNSECQSECEEIRVFFLQNDICIMLTRCLLKLVCELAGLSQSKDPLIEA